MMSTMVANPPAMVDIMVAAFRGVLLDGSNSRGREPHKFHRFTFDNRVEDEEG